jgi:predicted membrane-bound mannosyltransferase/DNA-binding beta-propeller fold protein YncE
MTVNHFDETPSNNALSRVFSRSVVLNWELIAYILIFVLAVTTRFYMLGERTMSHDESLHTVFSHDLFMRGVYTHDPMMHGPILFHMTALSYALFGVDDASSRFYPAILGIIMVMFPLVLRRWLGKTGAILASVMLLISPLVLYYNRYIREDTPSILAGMVLFWAALMYISGPEKVRRKAYWLYIVAASMLWNLGSKETAFIYVAIFGMFLLIYWLVRLYQHYFKADGRLLFYTIIMGVITGGTWALSMVVVISISLSHLGSLSERTTFVVNEFRALMSGQMVTIEFLSFLSWSLLTALFILVLLVATALWANRAKAVYLTMADVLVGTLSVAIAMFITRTFSHRTIETTYQDVDGLTQVLQNTTSTAGIAIGFGLSASLLLLLIYSVVRIKTRRSFLQQLFYILTVVLISGAVLVIAEELSHHSSRDGTTVPVEAIADDPLLGAAPDIPKPFKEYPLVMAWGIAGIVVGLMLYFKAKGWWREMNKYFPELDVLIVMGSMILPWLTAVFIVMVDSQSHDWLAIGNQLRGLQTILPVAGEQQIGQFVIGILAFLPMFIISVVVGLTWNWKRWLVVFVVFHVLFVLFFTTVFTNIQGFASGMVYSLQYWMEQQGVRRGSQPQYYYTNVIMPMYEYLPIVGSMLAMVAGWMFFWRKRAEYDDYRDGVAIADAQLSEIEQTHTTDGVEQAFITETSESSEDKLALFSAPNNSLWLGIVLGIGAVAGIGLFLFNMLLRSGQNVSFLGITVSSITVAFFGLILGVGCIVALFMWFAPRSNANLDEIKLRENYVDPFDLIPREADDYRGWKLNHVSFLLFVSWWAIFSLFGYTLAGEKMPWLGIHLTVPMIFMTAWFFGRVIERLEWKKVSANSWVLVLLIPLCLVSFVQMILPILGGQPPFNGVSRLELGWTYSWLLAVLIFVGSGSGIYWLSRHTGFAYVGRLLALVVFVILGVLTFRTSWLANYINYDNATEFIVYAHGGPANKFVMEQVTELSHRTAGGYNLRVMYDDKFAWPGSWYLREFRKNNSAVFLGNRVPTLQELDDVGVVIVGPALKPQIESLLEERYQHFEYIRMWWPMQDYFRVNAQNVNNFLDFTSTTENLKRRGLFDIWWSRDYSQYELARNREGHIQSSYGLVDWLVSEKLHVYIRRDIAAQVWQYGVGDANALNSYTEIQRNICTENYRQTFAEAVFVDNENPLVRPMGLTVAGDYLYVANDSESSARINVFTIQGEPYQIIGEPGLYDQDGAFFNRPNALAVAENGDLFIVDTWNFRIRRFDSDLNHILSWGEPHTEGFGASAMPYGGLWGPRDIVLDSGNNVFVTDTGNKRVRVYSHSGVYLFDIGQGGANEGDLNEPSGLAIHPDGRLFVADTWNKRISVFNAANGIYLESYPIRGWRDGTGNRPYLALDVLRDLLYVTDPDDGKILVLSASSGECVGSFGSRVDPSNMPDMSQFADIGGIAVDDDGNVYVSDTAFNRVLKFPPFAIHGSGISSDDGNEETADSEQDFEIEADIILPDEVDQIDRDMTEETEPDVDNGDNAGEAE